MKIVTWNVNSIRMRMPRLLAWLAREQPDIVCLQETKVIDADFPTSELLRAGYKSLFYGQKTYNGVAILYRDEATNIVRGLPNDDHTADKRVLSALINGIQIINIYAPNGSEVSSPKYQYKLEWYQRLRGFMASLDPQTPVLLCGDFNVAPEDRDVWDVTQWQDQVLFSEPEKAALESIVSWGFTDALRLHHPEAGIYTQWDYRGLAFPRGWGVRIDHILISAPLISRCQDVMVDRQERKGEKPSDHAPVMAIFS